MMDSAFDADSVWPVDIRTLSPHRGFVMSFLAPVRLDATGTPRAAVYDSTLFDASKLQALLDDLIRRIAARKGRFDLKRFAQPLRGTSDRWRQARSIDDLIGDDEFADHVYDRLVEYDRTFKRDPHVADLLGQPSPGLIRCTLGTLERLESQYAPMWARMQVECWPSPTKLPLGYTADETFPPRDRNDAFVYCYRVYDIDRAADILPEHYVRAFCDEIVRRALANGLALDDLVEHGSPSIFTLSAAAEALARGLMSLGEAIAFLKKRVAQKRTQFVEQALARSIAIEPGVILDIRNRFCALARAEHEFDDVELAEIALQWTIHSNDPGRIAEILYGLSLARPRSMRAANDPSVVRVGPLSIAKRELSR